MAAGVASLGFGPAALGAPKQSSGRRTNIVFIMADDLGWRDTSVYGSTFYETPNIDRLADRGMLFTNAYAANPLCSPTRASVLTGQYPGRVRFTTPAGHLPQVVLDPKVPDRGPPHQKILTPQTRTRLPNDYFTIANALKEGGYTTGFFGKWHLGRDPYLPENQGFDVVVGGREHPGPPPPGRYFAPWNCDTLPVVPEGTHISDALTDEAIKFVRDNKEGPFFLNLWYYDVHAPYQGKEKLIEKYRKKIDPDYPQRCPTMGAMIEALDHSVGRVMKTLDELDLADDTIVIFTSDNGGNMYDEVDGTTPTNNHPLRGGKATIYEGGTREPLIVVWPGRVAAKSRSEEIVSSVDYYTTMLEVAGLKPKPGITLDGISIVPAIEGGRLSREAIFCHFPHNTPATGNIASVYVRKGDWKLIRFFCDGEDFANRFELYNVTQDISEANDLAAKMPAKVLELDALIERHLKDTDALVPKVNPDYGKTTGGWTGNKDAGLSIEDGRLLLTSSGSDPFVETREIPPRVAGELTLLFRMKSDVVDGGGGKIYWATRKRKEAGFVLARSKPFSVKHDGQWREYSVTFKADADLLALRLDPATAPGELAIEQIRLKNAEGRVVKAWDF